MAYRTTLKILSLKYPDKTWETIDDFWNDHESEDSDLDVVLDGLEKSGKLTITETLSSDGTYITYQKDFDSEGTYNSYRSSNDNIIGDNETHYNATVIFKGSV